MKGLLLMLSVIVWGDLLAQKHDNIWMLGLSYNNDTSCIMSFPNNTCTINNNILRNMPMQASSVSMCDSVGNLLFYTNSIRINNAQYQLMDNGDSLNPGQHADNNRQYGYPLFEGTIAVPHPKQVNKYYLFHQSAMPGFNSPFAEYLYFTLIDMSANTGLGRVDKKNQILASDSLCEGNLETIKHANGKDWWLVQPMTGNNGYYTFLVTEDTIFLVHKQYIGNSNRISGVEWTGQAVFSPDGTKYARYDWKNDLDIFNFDRCTGLLSNFRHITIQDTCDTLQGSVAGGLAISANSRYLYVSALVKVYQFDLDATNVANSMDTIAIYDGFVGNLATIFGYLQLAPDNKIYGYASSTRYLHVINNPDVGGDSCDVQQHSIYIRPNGHFLPNFPHYRTPALDSLACVDTTHSGVNVVQVDKNTNEVRLYPNPVINELTIELSTIPSTEILVQIIDLTGKVLLQKIVQNSSNFLQIPTTNLSNGMYFVRVHLDNKMITQPLAVERY